MARRALVSSVFALMIGSVSAAHAQAPAENVAAARTLGVQGIKLADEGNCPAAIEKLERAEALYHAPTMLGRLGECQVQVGQIVIGTENLNRVAREQLPANSPKAFQDAQERARRVLEQALPRIAYLVLHVAPEGIGTTVTVGEGVVPPALLGAERPTDPGTYEIVASAPGYMPAKTTVTLGEGARQEITMTLSPDPAQAAKPPEAPAPLPTSGIASPISTGAPRDSGATARDNTLAYVLLGVGGAGLLTGTITGLLAISKKNDLECRNDRCPPDQHDTLDSARTMALVSTIGFGVGIAGGAAGTVLLLMGGKEATTAHVGSVTAQPFVAANAVGVVGSF
jgi:hypothetical protein